MSSISAYVDGSFNPSDNRYGYSAVILDENENVLEKLWGSDTGEYAESRQIAGEVFGALNAIHWAMYRNYEQITIYYDYIGIEKWATGEWGARKPVSQAFFKFYKPMSKNIKVKFVKVKAHSGVEFNEEADRLAKIAVGL